MKIDIKIDPAVTEPRVVIITDNMTAEIRELVNRLSEPGRETLSGSRDGKISLLDPDDITRIYAEQGKTVAECGDNVYYLRLRLYELERRLADRDFARISNSEIVNLKRVKNFDLSMTGTICVQFVNGTKTYVSRRYVGKIKKILGI